MASSVWYAVPAVFLLEIVYKFLTRRYVEFLSFLNFFNKKFLQGSTSRVEHFASLLSTILKKDIKEDPEQAQVLCKKCYKLVDELDELQNRVTEIKNEIIDSHKCSIEKTEVEDELEIQETKEIMESKSIESNKENEVPKKILDIPSSDEDSGQVTCLKKIILFIIYFILDISRKKFSAVNTRHRNGISKNAWRDRG